MRKIYIIALILLTSYVNASLAQNKLPIDTIRRDTVMLKRSMLRALEIPNNKEQILSPQIALMNQYGDYPVDLSNGLVDISIPLYNIQTSKLSLPIQLKFHPSGLKALERESMLGVRWVLDAGGHISRNIKGYPDEMLPFRKIDGPNYTPDFNALYGGTSSYTYANSYFTGSWEYRGEYMDTEYDIFSYSLPIGKSGKFIMADNNGKREAVTIPYEALKITPLWSYGGIGKFDVIDTDGTHYIYGHSLTGKGSCIEDTDYDMHTRAVAWYLTGIISADKRDTISIDYKQYFYYDSGDIAFETIESYDRYYEWRNPKSEYLIPKATGYQHPYFDGSFKQEKPYHIAPGDAYVIDEIRFKGGTIKFNYLDQKRPPLGGLTQLNNIVIYNSQKEIVKKISFNIKMNESNGFSLLHQVKINDTSTKDEENYLLDYYDSRNASSIITGKTASQSDRWGYHSEGKGNLIVDTITHRPHNTWTFYNKYIRGYKDMEADEESMKWGMVKSIQYPTGGKTLFDYEINQYTDYGVKKNCGGLRIKKLTNISELNEVEEKEYEYDMDVFAPYLKPLSTKYISYRNYFTERKIIFTMLHHHEGALGPNIFTTRTQGDLYHRSYRGTIPSAYLEFSNIISYNEVTEKIKSRNKGNGKIRYTYDHKSLPFVEKYPEDKYEDSYVTDNIHIISTDFWKNKNLDSKLYYREGETEPFKTIGYYYDTKIKKSVYDMYIFQYVSTYPVHKTNDSYSSMEKFELDVLNTPETFSHVIQKYDIGKDLLTMEVEITDNQSTVKEYTYDPVHFILESEKITSNKEVHKTNYKHPFNYTQEPYKSMVVNNILSPVIEKSVSKNDTFLERLITNYKQWAPNAFSPLNIQYQKGSKAIETRLTYNFDGRNQLREAVKDDISKVVYIRNAYSQPVAEIEGVSYDDVAKNLGQSTIDKIATCFVVSEADMLKINNLRSNLPQSSVITYTYKPLVGIMSITDPQGAKIFYEYDESNRLLNIKDMDGNTIESYDYHFSN